MMTCHGTSARRPSSAGLRDLMNVTGMRRTKMNVNGICCPAEKPLIEKLLNALPGISSIEVNIMDRTTTVEHDNALTTAGDLVRTLNAASLEASIGEREKGVKWPKWNVLLNGALFVISLISLGYTLDEREEGDLTPRDCEWCQHFKWAALAGIAFGWPPILRKAYGALRQAFKMEINCLMTLARRAPCPYFAYKAVNNKDTL